MSLERFRVEGEIGPRPTPVLAPAHNGVMLSFDPSLASTGWALVEGKDGEFSVLKTGMFRTTPDEGGQYDRMMRVTTQAYPVFEYEDYDCWAYESPPGGNAHHLFDRESAVLAVAALRFAFSLTTVVTPIKSVQAQKMKRRVTGVKSASKSQVRDSLVTICPELSSMKPLNEHVVDAVGIGVVALGDGYVIKR